jgi:hypothetical protein
MFPVELRKCPQCGLEKPLSEWPKNKAATKGRWPGYSSYCTICQYARTARRSLEQKMLSRSKSRALAKGLEHTITLEDIQIPNKCPLLGIEIKDNTGNGRGNCRDSPSLDRLDSSKGYTPDNVWVISNRANEIKSNATLEELETIAANLRAKLEGRL